jgi:hypothetical protein
MQHIDTHAARAELSRLWDRIEELDARGCGRYDPVLDDLQQEAAALRWELDRA